MNDASRGTKGCEEMTEKTFTFTNERMPSEHLGDGRQVVKVTPGGTKILATVVDGTITYYEAEDNTGNQRSLVFLRERQLVPGFDDVCWICVDDIGGGLFCYQDFCDPHQPPRTQHA